MSKNKTCPIPKEAGKKPKPKKLTPTQSKMGWEHVGDTHPHKENKISLTHKC